MTVRYIFVGERRSEKAQRMGVFWEHGRLAAKTLHEALRAIGIEPRACVFFNLYEDAPNDAPFELREQALGLLRKWTTRGRRADRPVVVALGRRVRRELADAGIPHVRLTHPAARGAIRKTERYRAHVAEVLS